MKIFLLASLLLLGTVLAVPSPAAACPSPVIRDDDPFFSFHVYWGSVGINAVGVDLRCGVVYSVPEEHSFWP